MYSILIWLNFHLGLKWHTMDTIFHVHFPRLYLKINVDPIAFRLSGFPVYWYGVVLCLSFIFGFFYSLTKAKKLGVDKNNLTDVAFFSILASTIGARLYYVLFCTEVVYFLKNPIKFFYFHEGGLAVYGGILAAIFVAFLFCKIKKMLYFKVLDVASFGIISGQCIGRWGNFFNQEAFGMRTSSIFGMCSESTGEIPVHPCFFYESFWCFIGLVFLEVFQRKFYKFDGELFLFYMIWYGTGRFFIEGLRTDSLMVPFTNFRISQIISLLLAISGMLILFIKAVKTKKVSHKF